MTISLVVMRTEYKKVHWLFYSGLFFFHASVALYTWGFDAAFTLSTRTCLVTCLFLSLSLFSLSTRWIMSSYCEFRSSRSSSRNFSADLFCSSN